MQEIRQALNISPDITTEGIKDLIRNLPNNKTPGPDGILNEILKIVAPTITKDLA